MTASVIVAAEWADERSRLRWLHDECEEELLLVDDAVPPFQDPTMVAEWRKMRRRLSAALLLEEVLAVTPRGTGRYALLAVDLAEILRTFTYAERSAWCVRTGRDYDDETLTLFVALAKECPACAAPAGKACRTAAGRRARATHPPRITWRVPPDGH